MIDKHSENNESLNNFEDETSIKLKLSKKFESNIPIIDYQHEVLLNLSTRLKEDDLNEDEFYDLIIELNAFLHTHFKTEEAYMLKINYPNFAEHKQEHDGILKQFKELFKLYLDKNNFAKMNLVSKDFLLKWRKANLGGPYDLFFHDLDLIDYVKVQRQKICNSKFNIHIIPFFLFFYKCLDTILLVCNNA